MSYKKYKNRVNRLHNKKIMDFEQMMSTLLKDKTVAVLGNASSLFDKQYGDEIDSHDIVIRINRGIEICQHPQHAKTHGQKVDIWCFNLYRTLEDFDNIMKIKIQQTYKKIQMNHSYDTIKYDYCISEELHDQIRNIVAPKQTTTGFRTLHYVSQFETKEISVYGFDWKKTPTYYVKHMSRADLNHDYIKEREYCFENYFKTCKMILKQ
jgi:hypothetical protein